MHSISLKDVEVLTLLCYIFYSFAADVLISSVFFFVFEVVVVQLPSHVGLFMISWTAAWQASLSLTISQGCPSSCPLHQWCHPAISSSDAPFSFCLQSLPASESFPISSLFTSSDQNTDVLASFLPVSIQVQIISLRLTGLISSVSKGLWILPQQHSSEASIIWHSAFFLVQLSQPYKTTGKTIVLTTWTFVSSLVSLLYNTFYRCYNFPAKKQSSSDFMAGVTICSDFRAQEEEI